MYIMHQTKFCNSYNETIRPFNMALENICQRTANVTICHILQSLGAYLGGHYSADWTTGLDYWTGLLDWTTGLDYWTGLLDWSTAGLD